MRREDDFFPAIAAELGTSASNTGEYRKKLEEFRPFVRVNISFSFILNRQLHGLWKRKKVSSVLI